MAKPSEDWNVRPHGPLTSLGENLFTVVGELHMPLGESRRRMTIARLADGRLVIYSAIALDRDAISRLEALGTPSFLIVPSAVHRLDVAAWKKRYPSLVVVAPPGARDKVAEVVAVDCSEVDFHDPRVELSVVAGTAGQEFSLMVQTETGKTLVVNDLIFNLPVLKGASGMMMKLLGFGPGKPHMPKLVMMKLLRDKRAVRNQLETWADTAELERVLVSHGGPIEAPKATLRELAQSLT